MYDLQFNFYAIQIKLVHKEFYRLKDGTSL